MHGIPSRKQIKSILRLVQEYTAEYNQNHPYGVLRYNVEPKVIKGNGDPTHLKLTTDGPSEMVTYTINKLSIDFPGLFQPIMPPKSRGSTDIDLLFSVD